MQKYLSRINSLFHYGLVLFFLGAFAPCFAFNWFNTDMNMNIGPQVDKQFSGRQANFVLSILESTDKTNVSIMKERSELLALQATYQTEHTLSPGQFSWLRALAENYHISAPDFKYKETWKKLDSQVDIIPPSLVLAQAIQESGWGRSDVANKGHNYFGQECFSRGCGFGHGHSMRGHYYEMAEFKSIDDAINHYIHNLNTNKAYRTMWNIRYHERSMNGGSIDSIALVNGLLSYSELGGHYVATIKKLVYHLNLQTFDH